MFLSKRYLGVYFNLCSTSGASMPRNSTMSGFGGTEKIKDSRPLHDKSFVQQCIRQLHEVKTTFSIFCIYQHNTSWKLNFITQRGSWQVILTRALMVVIKTGCQLFDLHALCHIFLVSDWTGLHRHFVIQDPSVSLDQGVCKGVWIHLPTIRSNVWDAKFKSWGGSSSHFKSPEVKCCFLKKNQVF